MLVTNNEISSQQSTHTKETYNKFDILLEYCVTHPDAPIRYHASEMYLHIDSDAVYFVQPKSRSRAAGNFFLSNYNFRHPISQVQ